MPDLSIKSWKGLRNDVSPERMESGDLTAAVNVLLRDDSRLTRRMGFLERHATVPGSRLHSLWTDGNQTGLCVRGRQLCAVSPTTFALSTVAMLTSDAPMNYASVEGRVYWNNGVERGIFQEGRCRTWGLRVPSAPGATITPGSMPAGRYQWAMVFNRVDGQQSGASDAGTIDLPANSGLLWSDLDVSANPDVTTKTLYLSVPDGEVMYRALVVDNAEVAAQYAGDTKELAYPLDTMHLAGPPFGQEMAFYAGRMWVGVGADVFPSSPFSAELFDGREFVPARGRVTMLAPRPDDKAMLIGTDAGMGWIAGADLASMEYAHALDDPVLPGSLVWIPGERVGDGSAGQSMLPMWAGTQGIYTAEPPYWTIKPVTLGRVQQSLQGRVAAFFDKVHGQYLATVSH